MIKTKYVQVKYRGTQYRIIQSKLNMPELSGVRLKKNGVIYIILFNSSTGFKRRLEFHRLITGRGLKDIKKKVAQRLI